MVMTARSKILRLLQRCRDVLRHARNRRPSDEHIAEIRRDPKLTERILIRYRETFELLGRE